MKHYTPSLPCLVKECVISLAVLVSQLRGFHLEQVGADPSTLTIVATATQPTALCRVCSSLASHVHSRY